MHTSSLDLPYEQWADELFDEVANRLEVMSNDNRSLHSF